MAQCEPREGRGGYVDVEPMVTASHRYLAVSVSEYYEDRKDLGDILVCIVLDSTQFNIGTHGHVHLLGPERHAREDEDDGPLRLHVLLHGEISLPSDTSQEYPWMCPNSQRRLAHGSGKISSRHHDKRRGERPRALKALHNVHVLRRLILQYDNAFPIASARKRAEYYHSTDGLPRLRYSLRFASYANLCLRFLPTMLYWCRHVQHHYVSLLLGSYVRSSRLWPNRHRDRSCGKPREK